MSESRTYDSPALARLGERFGVAIRDLHTYLVESGCHGFNLVRHRSVYVAVAQVVGAIDLARAATDDIADLRERGLWFEADTVSALRQRVQSLGDHWLRAELLQEGYRGFNIIAFAGRYHALAQNVGVTNVAALTRAAVSALVSRNQYRAAGTRAELDTLLTTVQYWPRPELLHENYRGFNLVGYEDRVHAVANRLGPLSIPDTSSEDVARHTAAGCWAVAETVARAREIVDRLVEQRVRSATSPDTLS